MKTKSKAGKTDQLRPEYDLKNLLKGGIQGKYTRRFRGTNSEGNKAMSSQSPQFIVDNQGRKKAILLPIKKYQKLMEDLHDLAIVAERKDEQPISFEEMKKRLEEDGILYNIKFKPSLRKDFRPIPKIIASRIWAKIQALADEPLPRGSAKLSGSESLYRIRVSDYRIIYDVDHKAHELMIHSVRHRKEAYKHSLYMI